MSVGKFKGVTVEKIIDTSMEIVRKGGIPSLTIHKIANELNIKPPSLYKHVSGLDEVRDAVHGRAMQILNRRIDKALAQAGTSAEKRLRAFLNEYAAFAEEEPGLYGIMQFTHIGRSDEVVRESEKLLDCSFSILRQFSVPMDQQVHVARFIKSWLHGFINFKLKNGFGLDEKIEDSFEIGINIILNILESGNLS